VNQYNITASRENLDLRGLIPIVEGFPHAGHTRTVSDMGRYCCLILHGLWSSSLMHGNRCTCLRRDPGISRAQPRAQDIGTTLKEIT
jgi:hypothetical protein